MNRPLFIGFAAALALGLASFSIACRLVECAPAATEETDSFFAKMLGDSRAAFSALFFESADRTFHKGVGRYEPKKFLDGFGRLAQRVTPEAHEHLAGATLRDIMPWLSIAIKTDPHNVTAYLVASFWLSTSLNRPDLALQALETGRRANPKDYRLYLEKGRIFLKLFDFPHAITMIDSALTLWHQRPKMDAEEAYIDWAELMTYRGILHEIDHHPEPAIACYQAVVDRFPTREGLKNRISEMTSQGSATSKPMDMLKPLLLSHQHVCDREEDAHDKAGSGDQHRDHTLIPERP